MCAPAGSSSLRHAATFIEHFPAPTDAHIALLTLPGELPGAPLHATLTARPWRVRATVSASDVHPGLGPRERSRTLRLNKAAIVPPSDAGPYTHCATVAADANAVAGGAEDEAGTSAAADELSRSAAALNIAGVVSDDSEPPPTAIPDEQRAMLLAQRLCDARGMSTCASVQAEPPQHAVAVTSNSVTLKYHAMSYRAVPKLHLRGCPDTRSAGEALMPEVKGITFKV